MPETHSTVPFVLIEVMTALLAQSSIWFPFVPYSFVSQQVLYILALATKGLDWNVLFKIKRLLVPRALWKMLVGCDWRHTMCSVTTYIWLYLPLWKITCFYIDTKLKHISTALTRRQGHHLSALRLRIRSVKTSSFRLHPSHIPLQNIFPSLCLWNLQW